MPNEYKSGLSPSVDIVERLRGASIYKPHEAENLCEKAADEIERLREALQHILTHCKSDTPPNAQAIILFANKALGKE